MLLVGSRELQWTSTQHAKWHQEFLKIQSMTVPQVGDNCVDAWLHSSSKIQTLRCRSCSQGLALGWSASHVELLRTKVNANAGLDRQAIQFGSLICRLPGWWDTDWAYPAPDEYGAEERSQEAGHEKKGRRDEAIRRVVWNLKGKNQERWKFLASGSWPCWNDLPPARFAEQYPVPWLHLGSCSIWGTNTFPTNLTRWRSIPYSFEVLTSKKSIISSLCSTDIFADIAQLYSRYLQ